MAQLKFGEVVIDNYTSNYDNYYAKNYAIDYDKYHVIDNINENMTLYEQLDYLKTNGKSIMMNIYGYFQTFVTLNYDTIKHYGDYYNLTVAQFDLLFKFMMKCAHECGKQQEHEEFNLKIAYFEYQDIIVTLISNYAENGLSKKMYCSDVDRYSQVVNFDDFLYWIFINIPN